MAKNLTYKFEYAKTSRGSCSKCKSTMPEGELKVGKEVPSRHHDGVELKFHHLDCIKDNKNFKSKKITETKDWQLLKWNDLLTLREILEDDLNLDEQKEEKLKEMNEQFWEAKEKLSDVNNKIIKEFLNENGFDFPEKLKDPAIVYDFAADVLTFGLLPECPECKQRKLSNHIFYISCSGNVTEYVKCDYKTDDVTSLKRFKATISDKIKKLDKKKILEKWEFPDDYPTETYQSGTNENGNNEQKEVEDDREEDEVPKEKELYGMKIYVQGTKKNLKGTISEWQDTIKMFGGEIVKNAAEATVCITTNEDYEAESTKGLKDAKETLTCLKIEWIEEITNRNADFMKLRKKEGASQFLCDNAEWKTEIVKKKYFKPKNVVKETFKPLDDSDVMKVNENNTIGSKTKVYLVDDEVFGWTAYTIKMTKTDLATGKNSFYNMQIVENGKSGDLKKYQLLKEWGRIGEDSNHVTTNDTLHVLLNEWKKKFNECTGFEWDKRGDYKQIPGRYFLQKLDTGKKNETTEVSESVKQELEEKRRKIQEKAKEAYLDPRVSYLIKMIFDKDMMVNTLKSQGLNTDSMPIGKIDVSQMMEAMKVLKQLSNVISPESELTEKQKKIQIQDLTTRYYTYVPHIMSVNEIKLIDNDEEIQKELKLVETMCDVGKAMELMKEEEELNLDEISRVYSNYQTLHTKINCLDKESERYKLLEEFFVNNQEKGHYRGKVDVVDIFEIERDGERERFKPFEEDTNRQLLYHGSRLTNFVGILSTGLRIAPPEAPCNGYRYGKGLYFANCASKSVSYCTYNNEKRGCMLLCDVALGRQWKTTKDKYMEKPQPNSDSTYALGAVEPDPTGCVQLEEGFTLNKGSIIQVMDKHQTWNSHSELIVYEVPRVTIRYLVIFELPK